MSASTPEQTCLTCTKGRLLGDVRYPDVITIGGNEVRFEPAKYRRCNDLPSNGIPSTESGAINLGNSWAFPHVGGCHVNGPDGKPAYHPMPFQRFSNFIIDVLRRV